MHTNVPGDDRDSLAIEHESYRLVLVLLGETTPRRTHCLCLLASADQQAKPCVHRTGNGPRWVTGITVITSYDAHRAPIGLVCNSFTSLSLDPPLVSWAIARTSKSIDAWLECGSYSVHILAADQTDLVTRFSRGGSDKFTGVETVDSVVDTPVIDAVDVRLDCRAWGQYEAGDHILLIGEVVNHQVREPSQESLTSLMLY